MMRRWTLNTVYFVVFFGFIFLFASICGAASVKTKMFYRNLQKSRQFVDQQYTVLMAFFDALTKEDIETINNTKNARSSSHISVKLFNQKAVDLIDQLSKINKPIRRFKPKYGGLPTNLCNLYEKGISWYTLLLDRYRIPQSEHKEVLDKYSEYLIHTLDRVQELTEKAKGVGLTLENFPNQFNSVELSCRKPIFLCYTKGNYSRPLYHGIVYNWKVSTKSNPELYSNQNVLNAQKLWMEFLLNEVIDSDKEVEEIMTELEVIEKHLASLSGTPKQIEKPAEKVADTKPDKPSAPAQKTKFKLDLPK